MLYTGLRSSVAASTTVNLMLVPLSPIKGVVLTILARHNRPLGAAGVLLLGEEGGGGGGAMQVDTGSLIVEISLDGQLQGFGI